MTIGVLLVVLAGALMHASWNLMVKRSGDTRIATAGVYVAAGAFSALVLPFIPPPAPASWPYLAVATVTEVIYGVLLAAAYRAGDLSHAYPIMRGTAPLLVALGSGVFIGDHLLPGTWLGVALVSLGIFSMVLDAHSRGHSGTATRLALLNAVVIALYTTVDGLGVRISGQPAAYSFWLFMLVGIPWLGWVLWRSERRAALAGRLGYMSIGGVCSVGSYGLALWAMTRAPVAAVAAVRETSIVFGTVLGALVLKERVTPGRALAACAIALGVWVIHGSAAK
jgi:drug/metabolite transporter (DMT)-like permease